MVFNTNILKSTLDSMCDTTKERFLKSQREHFIEMEKVMNKHSLSEEEKEQLFNTVLTYIEPNYNRIKIEINKILRNEEFYNARYD